MGIRAYVYWRRDAILLAAFIIVKMQNLELLQPAPHGVEKLVLGVDLPKRLASALEMDRGDVAAYLWSILDQKELVGVAPDVAACGGRRHARL